MSWVAYYIEVSSRQHEEQLRRRLVRPGAPLQRTPKQRSESWRRLFGRPWGRSWSGRWARRAAQRTGRRTGRRMRPSAGPVTPAGR